MIRIDSAQSSVPRTQPAKPAADAAESRPHAEDRYTPSRPDSTEGLVYSGSVAAGKGAQPNFQALREYVVSLLREQGQEPEELAASADEAAEAVSEDGYWGVEQTSERIFQFAVSAVGDDLGRLEKVRDAIMQGYEDAKAMLGGWLPEVSERTIERLDEKLDAWEQERRDEMSESA